MSDVILYKEDIDRLNSILQSLVFETKILSAILVNKDTRLLASQGTLALFDMSALAALIVGSFASTQGIAGLIGEKEFSMMSHCGKTKNLLITLVDDDTICAAIFDRQISLSAVSSSVARHIEELKAALFAIKQNIETMLSGPVAMPSLTMSDDDVEKGIDSFFNPEQQSSLQSQTQQTENIGKKNLVNPDEIAAGHPNPPATQKFTIQETPAKVSEQVPTTTSELEKSISNSGSPIKTGSVPPPSNTEYLYYTSVNFLKNKARQGATGAKKKNDSNLLSKIFNRQQNH